ncbi:AbrB/MazE/SpoVT family DNA-binding domain-containing protein [Candidatus Woesearchaeota archaeon]|nr:AbrB/MazE/SpoVT family DNA-binding domain-containing protein [Candidatus Woesearchaeota archaeon]
MSIGHVTQTGNISIPKNWREELGIELNSSVIIEKKGDKIIIEPLKKKKAADAFKKIDEEIKRKGITFTREEAIKDDLYD